MNYDKLVNEIQEKKITVDDLKETIEAMKAEAGKKEEEWKAERVREEEMNRLKEREMEEEWKNRLERAIENKVGGIGRGGQRDDYRRKLRMKRQRLRADSRT